MSRPLTVYRIEHCLTGYGPWNTARWNERHVAFDKLDGISEKFYINMKELS